MPNRPASGSWVSLAVSVQAAGSAPAAAQIFSRRAGPSAWTSMTNCCPAVYVMLGIAASVARVVNTPPICRKIRAPTVPPGLNSQVNR
jgi:hypothetical protein